MRYHFVELPLCINLFFMLSLKHEKKFSPIIEHLNDYISWEDANFENNI